MPRNKDLKRLVRVRMQKTGEAYTAARAQVLRKPRKKSAAIGASPSPKPAPAPKLSRSPKPASASKPASARGAAAGSVDYAAIAGMSDVKVKEKTGCTWERWTHTLDALGAAQMVHRDIAALVHEKYKIDGWWSQMITVGYERIRGLRARGQRRDGAYEVSKSRTFPVPVKTLFDAWADARIRRRWLGGETVRVRTATAPKSMRLDWGDRSIIALWFLAKGESKSTVALQHSKVPDKEAAAHLKQYWSERLDALAEVLGRR